MNNEFRPRCIPGQMRRPKPKGRSNSLRLMRGWVVELVMGLVVVVVVSDGVGRKRSGLKRFGSGNRSVSRMIPYMLA